MVYLRLLVGWFVSNIRQTARFNSMKFIGRLGLSPEYKTYSVFVFCLQTVEILILFWACYQTLDSKLLEIKRDKEETLPRCSCGEMLPTQRGRGNLTSFNPGFWCLFFCLRCCCVRPSSHAASTGYRYSLMKHISPVVWVGSFAGSAMTAWLQDPRLHRQRKRTPLRAEAEWVQSPTSWGWQGNQMSLMWSYSDAFIKRLRLLLLLPLLLLLLFINHKIWSGSQFMFQLRSALHTSGEDLNMHSALFMRLRPCFFLYPSTTIVTLVL